MISRRLQLSVHNTFFAFFVIFSLAKLQKAVAVEMMWWQRQCCDVRTVLSKQAFHSFLQENEVVKTGGIFLGKTELHKFLGYPNYYWSADACLKQLYVIAQLRKSS